MQQKWSNRLVFVTKYKPRRRIYLNIIIFKYFIETLNENNRKKLWLTTRNLNKESKHIFGACILKKEQNISMCEWFGLEEERRGTYS
jgi:hypothetical protein